jgi:hypothetical protein
MERAENIVGNGDLVVPSSGDEDLPNESSYNACIKAHVKKR